MKLLRSHSPLPRPFYHLGNLDSTSVEAHSKNGFMKAAIPQTAPVEPQAVSIRFRVG
jgi:hypothetical protein